MDTTRMTINQVASYLEQRGDKFAIEEDNGIVRTGYRMPALVTDVVIAVTHEGRLIQVITYASAPVQNQRIGMLVFSVPSLPFQVMKKLITTVVTTISMAIVLITALYCANIGIGEPRKWCTPCSG